MSDEDFYLWQKEAIELLTPYRGESRQSIQGRSSPSIEGAWTHVEIPLIHCQSYFEIIRIVGELKSHFSDRNVQVYLRGQRNSYNYHQIPSLLRSFFDLDLF